MILNLSSVIYSFLLITKKLAALLYIIAIVLFGSFTERSYIETRSLIPSDVRAANAVFPLFSAPRKSKSCSLIRET